MKLIFSHVYYSYTHNAENYVMRDFTFDFSRPGIYCIYGPSGSGKTTLLNLISGLLSPSRGKITVDLGLTHARIGYSFQEPRLFPWLTVSHNIESVMSGDSDIADRGNYIRTRLAALGIAALSEKMPHELSGGEKQRVNIVRSMINEPSLLLLDEPTNSLDYRNRAIVEDMIIGRKHGSRSVTIFITHQLHQAVRLADTILVCRKGFLESPHIVHMNRQHPRSMRYVREYSNKISSMSA